MPLTIPQTLTTQTDSLSLGADALSTSVESSVADTLQTAQMSLEGLFGESARVVEQTFVEAPQSVPLTDNWVVSLLLVGAFIYYCFVLWAYGSHIGLMAKVTFGNGGGTRVADEVSYLFMRAVRNLDLVGLFVWSLVAIKWIELLGGQSHILPNSLLLVPGAIVVAVILGAIQRGATTLVLRLVGRRQLGESIGIVASTTLALTTAIATPIALLFVLNTGTSQEIIGYVCLAMASLGLILFCTKSLIFFIEQKISILLWILYLCAVILIPIGVVARLVAGGGII